MPAPIGDDTHPTRPTREQSLMQQAQIVAARSTCSRAHVGVVIAYEGRVVSQGYNGAPAGMPHCDHTCSCGALQVPGKYHDSGCMSIRSCMVAVHAEANSIAFAARYGVATQGAHLFTTLSPCLACAQLIINAGIVHVTYAGEYRYDNGLTLLMEAGIPVIKV